ncbi:helix-turn-helix domain-containing protein [Novosphingobium decolorationis]|uniref:helix-turn-helix domain-containing protein n=1 Tax=Novosphingobium decolorationis TaxID=2698673 RepID=UPI001BCB5361|nr:helix-turn-helix domain-containing protein [Novosphingobium decolorationis]
MEKIQYYTVNQTCSILRVGRTKLYELMNTGELRFIIIGSVRRISHSALLRFQEENLAAA